MMKIIAIVSLLLASVAFSFPELTRHGYARCQVCHVSVSGGGTLNKYGRQMSREILSASSGSSEWEPLYGIFPLSDRLMLGGDIRSLYYYQNESRQNQSTSFSDYRLMQLDVELAAQHHGVTAVTSLGTHESLGVYEPNTLGVFSRRHYLGYQSQDGWGVRLGKFQAAYGLSGPDHRSFVRTSLGWGIDSETYNLEVNYGGVWGEGILTYSFGRPDKLSRGVEKGPSWRFAYAMDKSIRAGLSLSYRYLENRKRYSVGPFIVADIIDNLFVAMETNYDEVIVHDTRLTHDILGSQKLVWVPAQGLWLELIYEQRLRFDTTQDFYHGRYGLGVRYFPRPHLEFTGNYFYEDFGFEQSLSRVNNWKAHWGYVQAHFYF